MHVLKPILILVLVYLFQFASAQVHPNAHAHNDYEHSRPLLDALANGFASVEADIHLIAGELYVSHGKPTPSPLITLEKLYLQPLDSLCARYGSVYKDSGATLLLLIDIKTDAKTTVMELIRVMKRHPTLFPQERPSTNVQVIISGNRDYDMILKEDLVSLDGRPNDLGRGFSSGKMPVISDHFGNWMHWNGRGKPETGEIQKVRTLASRTHAEGKKLRLWAIPDNENSWQVLLEAGVDLINTDQLHALNDYLVRKSPPK